jgi:hypothetical protein
MWLINTATLQLEAVDSPEDHEYAVLSHTWAPRKVFFEDIADRTNPSRDQDCPRSRRHVEELALGSSIALRWMLVT